MDRVVSRAQRTGVCWDSRTRASRNDPAKRSLTIANSVSLVPMQRESSRDREGAVAGKFAAPGLHFVGATRRLVQVFVGLLRIGDAHVCRIPLEPFPGEAL